MCPAAISKGGDISKIPGCHLLWQMSLQWGSQRIGVSWNNLPFCFFPIFNSMNNGHLSKGCKPDDFESGNPLRLSFTNILSNADFSLNQTLLTFWLCVRQTWMTQLIQVIICNRFSFYLNGFYYSCAWSCSLCEESNCLCMGLISRKLYRFFCFWLALLHSASSVSVSILHFFFLYQPLLSLCSF